MRKIRFMCEEFLRSFRKSLFKNILLMIMFSFSIVMTIIMCSYYFDIDERYSIISTDIENSSWYNTTLHMDSSNEINLNTVSECRNLMSYYEYLISSNSKIVSINTDQQLYLKENEMAHFFGARSNIDFVTEEQTELITGYWDEEVCNMYAVKCMQVDTRAYDILD